MIVDFDLFDHTEIRRSGYYGLKSSNKKISQTTSFLPRRISRKLYVSRQTISNWENERSYPDIHNLLLLSVLFDVSLDE
ncbi:helix-turn-helix transcriptional regulator [Enterococcus mundtii]|uniref:helix-turn-helix transcriptional regulator n=1 Tax=Enterococcus mundtii TaxID=53346 RepID=UPI00403C0473